MRLNSRISSLNASKHCRVNLPKSDFCCSVERIGLHTFSIYLFNPKLCNSSVCKLFKATQNQNVWSCLWSSANIPLRIRSVFCSNIYCKSLKVKDLKTQNCLVPTVGFIIACMYRTYQCFSFANATDQGCCCQWEYFWKSISINKFNKKIVLFRSIFASMYIFTY